MNENGDNLRVGDLDAARRVFGALTTDSGDGGDDPADGSRPGIDGYLILHELGAGGSGQVYYAVTERSNHPVALKVFRRRRDGSGGPERAWSELELLRQLHLPFVPRVYDFGVAGGRPYIATDYVEGRRLDEHGRTLDRREQVELLALVCDRVDELHEYGILHGDLKPANLLIDRYGLPVVIDYGMAHLRAEEAERRGAHGAGVEGTLAYMSPEQARGDRGAVTTRSDIYGLGATAFKVLLGEPALDTSGDVDACLHRVAHETPRDARAIDPSFPAPLARILARAMAVDPRERYARASELAADLRRWAAGAPLTWTDPPRRVLLAYWIKCNRRLAAVGAVAAAAGVIALSLGVIAASERAAKEHHERTQRKIIGTVKGYVLEGRYADVAHAFDWWNHLVEQGVGGPDLHAEMAVAKVNALETLASELLAELEPSKRVELSGKLRSLADTYDKEEH